MAYTDKHHHEDTKSALTTPEERTKLPAEKLFDSTVYGILSVGLGAVAAMTGTQWVKHGAGKPIFDRASRWMGRNVLEKITSKRGVAAAKEADIYLVSAGLISISSLFVFPVKWLENHKPEIVEYIDTWQNKNKEQVFTPEQEHMHQKALEDLRNTPVQSWCSLWLGRAAGLSACAGTIYTLGNDRNEQMQKATANLVTDTLEHIGFDKLAKNPKTAQLSELAFVEFFYSMIAAGGLYAYSHYLHPQIAGDKLCNPLAKNEEPPESLVKDAHIATSQRTQSSQHPTETFSSGRCS